MKFGRTLFSVSISISVGFGSLAVAQDAPPLAAPGVVVGVNVEPTSYTCDDSAACDGCPSCGAACGDGFCNGCCPMEDVCCRTMEEVTVDKQCWKIGCEKVCIPPVCLPKCICFLPLGFCRSCANCRIRSVNTLEKHEYECTACECKWEVRCVPTCCGGAGCDGADACCVQTTPAVQTLVTPIAEAAKPAETQPLIGRMETVAGPAVTQTVTFEELAATAEASAESTAESAQRSERSSRLWSWARGGIISGRENPATDSAE